MQYFKCIINFMKQQDNFLLKIQSEFTKLSNWEYFEPAIAIFTILLFFILGRKTYESKFSQILNIINDSQNQKRRLKQQSQEKSNSLKAIKGRLMLFKIFTFACVVMLGIYVYLNNFKIEMSYLIWGGAVSFIFWMIVIFRIQYLEIMLSRTDAKLQRKNMSSETDTRQIMSLLGEPLCNALKSKFERELQMQHQQEELKECDLKKCHDEKKTFKELYQLYKNMIAEMQKMSWCNVCSQGLNIEANQLKIAEIESRLKTYRAAASTIGLQKKKELTNRLLEEWERLQSKLPKICKKGCCIRFRVVLEEIKKAHHNQLSSLKSRLSAK